MCKFIQLKPPYNFSVDTLRYIPMVLKCYERYSKYFQDDFASDKLSVFLENSPFFWIILDKNNFFAGFASLDNFIGDENYNFSAELTTCFEPWAWGVFTRYSAKFFLKKCFDEFNLYKIKAHVYKDNFRVKTLLKSSGFNYEATLPSETMRNGKPQDIDVYALYRNYYYKNEVKYD